MGKENCRSAYDMLVGQRLLWSFALRNYEEKKKTIIIIIIIIEV